jgi:hypothetical protein
VVSSRGFTLVWERWTPSLNRVNLTIPLADKAGLSEEILPGLVRYELASMWQHALHSPHIPSRALPRSLPLVVLNVVSTPSTGAGDPSSWELVSWSLVFSPDYADSSISLESWTTHSCANMPMIRGSVLRDAQLLEVTRSEATREASRCSTSHATVILLDKQNQATASQLGRAKVDQLPINLYAVVSFSLKS